MKDNWNATTQSLAGAGTESPELDTQGSSSLRPRSRYQRKEELTDNVLHHVDDDIGVFVEDHDVGADNAALVGRRQRRKFTSDFDGARLEFFLEARGKSAVAFELLFKAGRQIATALSQAG